MDGAQVITLALIIALHAARLRTPDAVAAVLWYRIITVKIGTALPWMGYQYLRDRPCQDGWPKLRARS